MRIRIMFVALVLILNATKAQAGGPSYSGPSYSFNFTPHAFSGYGASTPAFIPPPPPPPPPPPCPFNGPFAPTSTPPGTFPVCGTGPGQFRPQPYTLSGGFPPEVVSAKGSFYAGVGPNQSSWYQLSPGTSSTSPAKYGPMEPNPFSPNGNLSIPRAINHVTQTRVIPAINRFFGR